MRRTIFICLLCGVLLLTGCGGGESAVAPAIKFRASLVQAGGCSFTAEITADFGERAETFTVSCQVSADGTAELTVLQPETLSGITATVSGDGGRITYDGMAMDFGLLADGNVVPAAAPALVATCWSTEYIASAGTEGDLYRVTYEKGFEEKTLTVDTWFENDLPISSEVCYNQTRILKLTLSDFTFNE